MDLQLDGKVAVITGSSRGLGLASARSLVAEGARVCLSARGADRLADAVAELRDAAGPPGAASGDGGVIGIEADLSTEAGVARVIDGAVEAFGGLDILVNNVGKAGGGGITEATDAEWRAALDQTLHPAVRASRLAVPHLRARGGGVILMIASIWGRESGGRMTYNAVKAAEISLAKSPRRRARGRQHPGQQRGTRLDLLPRRLVGEAPGGRPRGHGRLCPARDPVRPLRPCRGGRRRGSLPRLLPRELGHRSLRHRRRGPVAVAVLTPADTELT